MDLSSHSVEMNFDIEMISEAFAGQIAMRY